MLAVWGVKMSKLTVITATYNRSKLLPRAIESVLNQSFEDFEYVIINNGSTDDTQDVIDSYMSQDRRIRCIKNDKNSLSGQSNEQRKLNIETKENKFCTWVDDDDWIHNNMLDTLYHMAIDTGSDICSVGSEYVFPDGKKKDKYVFAGQYTFNRIDAMIELLKREKINSASGGKLYRKKLHHNLDLPEVPRIRDIHVQYRVMNRINQMTISGEPMYYFYRHDGNVSGLNTKDQITPELLREHLYANHLRTDYLKSRMPEIEDFVLYSEYSFMLSLTDRIHSLSVVDCYEIAEEMKKRLIDVNKWLFGSGYLNSKEEKNLLSYVYG